MYSPSTSALTKAIAFSPNTISSIEIVTETDLGATSNTVSLNPE